jgi:hypothetical protein
MMHGMHNSELVDEMEKASQELQKWIQERVRNVEDIKKKHQTVSAKCLSTPPFLPITSRSLADDDHCDFFSGIVFPQPTD